MGRRRPGQGILRVRKQLQRIDSKFELTEPKTDRSRRTIALPAFAVAALREHRVRQLQERLLAGDRWQEWRLVFTTARGTPIDASNLTGQYHRLLEQAGLPRRRFHDLRHTCATLLLLQGEDLRVVMDVLGHSQISLTANTYQHVREALKRGAADKMQALFAAQR
jgi:integrase